MRLGKLYSADEIISQFKDGQTILVGGFGHFGTPERLIDLVLESGARHLTTISLNSCKPGYGIGRLLSAGVVDKMITSHIGNNRDAMELYEQNKLEVEFCPMGTLAERLRAGGAGIAAFYVRTGYGTGIEKGKEVHEFDGKMYMLETALSGDVALVRCRAADPLGNLAYHGTNENSNPLVAMNSTTLTIADPDIILEIDEIGPDRIGTPGVYVNMVLE
ncbi:MAG: CoA transferase subunit A [Eubacterium sp.]|nr:CoA transferase subunit A [Eubacterium sp.]